MIYYIIAIAIAIYRDISEMKTTAWQNYKVLARYGTWRVPAYGRWQHAHNNATPKTRVVLDLSRTAGATA